MKKTVYKLIFFVAFMAFVLFLAPSVKAESTETHDSEISTIEIWIAIFGVLGTWIIACLAIWGGLIRSFVVGPKLKLELHDAEGEITKSDNGIPRRYYHLDVINKRKAVKAENVRVLVTKLLRPLADGRFEDDTLNSPLHLTWQFPSTQPKFLTIGYNHESCDLGYIPEGGHFRLTPYLVPNKYNVELQANNKIRVELVVIAENAASNKIYLEISWDGEWSDDSKKMKKHLVVKEI